jgi:hypothetical protein
MNPGYWRRDAEREALRWRERRLAEGEPRFQVDELERVLERQVREVASGVLGQP